MIKKDAILGTGIRVKDFPEQCSCYNPVHVPYVKFDRVIKSKGWFGSENEKYETMDIGGEFASREEAESFLKKWEEEYLKEETEK
jgi:hypothetical protein